MKKIAIFFCAVLLASCQPDAREVGSRAWGDLDTINYGTAVNSGDGESIRSMAMKVTAAINMFNTLGDTFALKLNITDTAAMLTPYLLATDLIGSYIGVSDTAAMLLPYLKETDNIDFSQINMSDGDYAELSDYAVMLADTTPLKTFEFGSGLMKDTADFYNGAIKSFYNSGSDTLAITSLMGVMAEGVGTESVGVQVSWHTTFKSGSATNLNSSAFTVTSLTTGNEDVSFANAKIPPENFVWATLSGITSGNKPSYLAANLSGYRIPGIASTIPDDPCYYTQNLVLYSEDIGNIYWGKVGVNTTASNAEYDLEGNATLEEMTINNATNRLYTDGSSVTVIPGETYRWSFDVKRGTSTELMYRVYNVTAGSDIVAATSYYSQTSATETKRISVEFTAPAGCTSANVYMLNSSGLGTVYLGRAQVEENGSCYVETTSSIITP